MKSQRDRTLPRRVRDLVRAGVVPRQFQVSNIRPHLSEFSENYVRTCLANWCERGNYEKQGLAPEFRRVKPGVYELLEIRTPATST
jgi:hypothetical protein